MKDTAHQFDALDRAKHGQALTNYPAIFAGFEAKGIPSREIKPRQNVFTFNAWKALGRTVKKGEHGVKVVTFISGERERNGETESFRFPRTTTVFHITQTKVLGEEA